MIDMDNVRYEEDTCNDRLETHDIQMNCRLVCKEIASLNGKVSFTQITSATTNG